MKASVAKGVLASLAVALTAAALPQNSFANCYTTCRPALHRRIVRTTVIERRVARPVIVERIISRPTVVERVIERPTIVEQPVYVVRHKRGLIPKAYSMIFGGG